MSGGFFRGTTADQDTRFSNKHAKLLKSQKFPPELENLVDMTKVKMDVMRPWIAHRVTELLGFEDEVLINFIYGLLEEKVVNGKEIQISLTGFMEKNTGKFMKELWTHLLSAQQNASGVPQQFLDAKEEETRKKQEDTDRITRELKKTKEKEGREHDEERDKEVDNRKAAALEPHPRRPTKFSSKWSADDRETDERNGSKGLVKSSRSPHAVGRSQSPPRGVRSRSNSKSSNSRSHSRSRSLSASPKHVRRSVSSERRHHSLSRRSFTPRRVDSRLRSPSLSPSRGRSPSPARRRLQSPTRHRSRSPVRQRRPRSPVRHRRSRSPVRQRRSRSPVRRRSRSPVRRRSRSPLRRRSRSPIRRRSRSPIPRRLRSPIRRRSRSPIWRRSRSPVRRRSRTPIRRRSPSPFQRRPRSPYRHMSQSSASLSPSPVRGRSPSPMRRRYQRSPSTPRHHSPPFRRRTTFTARQRSPSPRSMSLSPSGRISRSPTHGTPSALPKRGSPKRQQRSPVQSPKDVSRIVQRHAHDHQPPREVTAEHPPVSVRSSKRDLKGRRVSHNGGTASSPSPYNSPRSVSPPTAGRSPSVRSPIPSKRHRESMNSKDDLDDVQVEDLTFSRVKADRRENKDRVITTLDKNKRLPEKLPSSHSSDAQAQKRKSNNDDGRINYPELTEESTRSRKNILSSDRAWDSGKGYKADDVKGSPRHHEASKLSKLPQKAEKPDQSGSLNLGSDESDGQKRKRKRSKKKDILSDDDDNSHDSRSDDRMEAKKRRKEEKRLKKEEKRKRREERRRKKDNRRSEKLKQKAGRSVSLSSDLDKSPESHDDAMSDQKKLEIELREKALESLRAKKGVGH